MRMQIIYILTLPFLLALSSCGKDWLDQKPESNAVIPATLKDCQALLDNNAVMLVGGGLGEVGSDNYFLTDANAQLYLTPNTRNAYTWEHKQTYSAVFEWTQLYNAIFYANLVLETIDKITVSASNQTEWNNIKGQALFQRARYFFELSQVYAQPYIKVSAQTDLGIPLRLETDLNIPTNRSSVQETYERIEIDLLEAKNILPVIPTIKARASKPAAMGLLARMYLSQENYSSALLYSDSTIYYYPTLIDYSKLSKTIAKPFVRFNNETIFYSIVQSYSLLFNNRFNISTDIYDSYAKDDLRKALFFVRSNPTGPITFKGFYTGANANISGIVSDEQYLIRAEAYARAGKVSEAMASLNALMKTRWDPAVIYPEFKAGNAEEALKLVLQERRKELLLRGVRWSDLRRLNRDPRFATTLTRTLNGVTYTLEPNSYKYTLPIPDDIIQITGIKQNPGWEK